MKKFLSGLLIAGALLLAGCSGVLEEPTLPASSGTTGTVLVQIGSPAAARTLAPTSGIAAYIVRYAPSTTPTTNTGEWTDATVDATSHEASIELEPGKWDFEVIGYHDADKKQAVATGSTSVTVEKGKVATAAILLTKGGDTNVAGKFSYNVDWTALGNYRVETGGYTTGVSALSLTLTPKEDISGFENVGTVTRDLLHGITTTATGETIAWPTTTHVTGTLNLPSGVYDMDIALTVGDGASINSETTVAHRTEVVYIYSYLTTETPAYVFTDVDIQKLHLTGPKPRLTIDGSYATSGDYVAQSFSLYNSGGDIIPFYRTNDGTTTATSYSVTGLTDGGIWEVYIPGYAVNSIVSSGSTEITMATQYSGIANPVTKTIAIQSKQGSVYDYDDLNANRRNVHVVTASIPGAAVTAIAAPQFNDGGTASYATHYVAEGHSVNVRASIGTASDYKVSYIDVRDANGTSITSSGFNPSLSSDTAGWNRWDNGFTVPSGTSDITVTVHYFHTGDVVKGSDIGLIYDNAEYTIAYVNSGAEHAGTLSSFTVLDAQPVSNNGTYTAQSANSGSNAWDYDSRGFSLTTISQLGYVLAQSRINTSTYLVQGSTVPVPIPARYWSSDSGSTITLTNNIGGTSNYTAYVYKDNSIAAHRTVGVPSDLNNIPIPTATTAYGVAVPNGASGTHYPNYPATTGTVPYSFIDSSTWSSDTGYVQLVKTVTIP